MSKFDQKSAEFLIKNSTKNKCGIIVSEINFIFVFMSKITLKIDEKEEKNGLVFLIIEGMFGTEDLPALKKWSEDVQKTILKTNIDFKNKIKVLIDIKNLQGYTDPQVLLILGDLMKVDSPYVAKTASFGGSYPQEMAQEVIKAVAERDNLKNFKTEKEARKWLEEK